MPIAIISRIWHQIFYQTEAGEKLGIMTKKKKHCWVIQQISDSMCPLLVFRKMTSPQVPSFLLFFLSLGG